MSRWFDEHDDAIKTSHRRVAVVSVDDRGTQQLVTLTGLVGEQFSGVVRNQHFGFSSNPPAGSEGTIHEAGGRADRAHVLGLEHPKYRPVNTPSGGSVVYDQSGNVSRYLGSDGIWHDAGNRPQRMTGKTVDHLATDEASIGASKGKTYLGGNGKDGNYAAVVTTAGPSSVVFAKL